MIRQSALAIACALALGACTPVASYQGFQAVEQNPKDAKVGLDTKSTILDRLGSPSTVAAFDPNTWYYITQVTDRLTYHHPQVRSRTVVSIVFDKTSEQVTAVNSYTLKDGRVIAYNGRETPTRGRELSVLEQLLGNVGRGTMLPRDQDRTPGSRPGQ